MSCPGAAAGTEARGHAVDVIVKLPEVMRMTFEDQLLPELTGSLLSIPPEWEAAAAAAPQRDNL